jgi:salicylate hydroxylase
MSADPLRVAVIGGGIGGVATALALFKRGLDVHLYEQAP